MKKFIYLFLLLIVCKAQAQQDVVFKMKYMPNHSYDGQVGMKMDCNINLSGDSAIINKMKSQGLNMPLALSMNMTMGGATKTGAVDTKKNFPLVMTYKMDKMSMNMNGNEMPIPAAANTAINVYGHVGADGKLKADSVGGKMKDTSQKKMMQLMNAFQNKIQFPDKPLHVGDTFTQDMPLNIPMAGNDMAANSKAVYKLTSIADGKAYFDVDQSMDMSIPIKGQLMKLTGTGSGKFVFDMKNEFPTDYKTVLNLKFSGKMDALVIDATAVMNIDFQYTIN